MIELAGLSKTYARGSVKAVDSVSLRIPDGGIFGFLGPNGAGKTTAIKMMTGALLPDSGSVRIDGMDLAAEPLAAKLRFGYVGDNPELFNRLRAREYLNFIADVYRIPDEERASRIEAYSTRFGLAEVLSSPIGSYSRGMKQKLCVIGSLLHEPGNWILDEPLVGLDPQAAFDLKATMRERAARGLCVFFSTHVMEVAEKICDGIAIIDRGKIVFTGSIDALRTRMEAEAEKRKDRDGAERSGGGAESLEQLFLELVDPAKRGEGA
jgi:ABC-2 type transport system ATP-binding protein